MTRKPLLAVDVDGVVSLFGFETPPEGPAPRFELVDGVIHCLSITAGQRLRQLGEYYDIVWASGWEDRTGRLAEILELPEYPYLTFEGKARFGSADWKLAPLEEYARGRALAWIDDSLDESCYEWARARPEPTLLMETESPLGIQDIHVEALVAWAGGPGAKGAQPRAADRR